MLSGMSYEEMIGFLKKSISNDIELRSVCYFEKDWEKQIEGFKKLCPLEEGYIYYRDKISSL